MTSITIERLRSELQIRFVTMRIFLDFRNLTAMAVTPSILKWSNYYICLRKTG